MCFYKHHVHCISNILLNATLQKLWNIWFAKWHYTINYTTNKKNYLCMKAKFKMQAQIVYNFNLVCIFYLLQITGLNLNKLLNFYIIWTENTSKIEKKTGRRKIKIQTLLLWKRNWKNLYFDKECACLEGNNLSFYFFTFSSAETWATFVLVDPLEKLLLGYQLSQWPKWVILKLCEK